MSFQDLLYNPIYNSFLCSDASFRASTGGAAKSLRIFDGTTGVSVADARTQIETVRPVCFVRAVELAQKNIVVDDLPESLITFNGNTWRIKANRVVASPAGEADGEIMLILLSEG